MSIMEHQNDRIFRFQIFRALEFNVKDTPVSVRLASALVASILRMCDPSRITDHGLDQADGQGMPRSFGYEQGDDLAEYMATQTLWVSVELEPKWDAFRTRVMTSPMYYDLEQIMRGIVVMFTFGFEEELYT